MNDNANNLNEVDDVLKQYLNDIEIEPSASLYNKVRKRRATPFWFYRNLRLLLTLVVLISTLSVYLSLTYPGFHYDSSEQTAAIGNENSVQNNNSKNYIEKNLDDSAKLGNTISNLHENQNDLSSNEKTIGEKNLRNVKLSESDDIIKDSLNTQVRKEHKKRDKKNNEKTIQATQTEPQFLKEDTKDNLLNINNGILIEKSPVLKPINKLSSLFVNRIEDVYLDDSLSSMKSLNVKSVKYSFFVEIAYDITFNKFSVNAENIESQSISQGLSKILTSNISYNNWTLLMGCSYITSSFKAGITFRTFSESFIYSDFALKPLHELQQIYNGTPWSFTFNNEYFYIDSTSGYFHYYYLQDSVTHIIDSSWQSIYDTSLVNIFDTVTVITEQMMKYRKKDFTYRIFEFPVIYTYRYPIGRWAIDMGIGVIPGIINATPRYYYNGFYFENLNAYKAFNKFVLSASCMLGVRYWLNEKSSVFVNAGYKKGFSSVNSHAEGTSMRISSEFLQFGLTVNLK